MGPLGLERPLEVRDGPRARGEEGAVVPPILYAALGERFAAEERTSAAEGVSAGIGM